MQTLFYSVNHDTEGHDLLCCYGYLRRQILYYKF